MALVMTSPLEMAMRAFYKKQGNFTKLVHAYDDRQLPPRLIDFYITQYAKRHPQFFIPIIDGKRYGLMDVYSSYKLQLKGYHKRSFNLFDKDQKKTIRVSHDESERVIEMSVPRLNVYRWLIDNDIMQLIQASIFTIQTNYYEYRKTSTKPPARATRRGKMTTFIQNPLIVEGLSITDEKKMLVTLNET
jgi:hypothetical protein